ncbi:MAG: hypothetical protein U0835_23945 [Isosphaeraceae bacterium]
MRLLRVRITARRAMIAVALVALLTAMLKGSRRRLTPTPAEWAWDQADDCERSARVCQSSGALRRAVSEDVLQAQAKAHLKEAARYRELARTYAAEGAPWAEAAAVWPYSDRLVEGETVATMADLPVGDAADAGLLPVRTVCVVVSDPAWKVDDDGLSNQRLVEARVSEGPLAGRCVRLTRALIRRVRR